MSEWMNERVNEIESFVLSWPGTQRMRLVQVFVILAEKGSDVYDGAKYA